MDRLVLALALSACSSGGPTTAPMAPASPPTNTAPANPGDIAHRAELALRTPSPPDYERPFVEKPGDRDAVATLHLDACKNGNKPACWIAMTLTGPDDRDSVTKLVETNCQAGDLMSCRALPVDASTPRYPEAPGAMGRRVICQESQEAPCDLAVLRSECTNGFPRSCRQLGISNPPLPDRDQLLARFDLLSATGCALSIIEECERASMVGVDGEQLKARQRRCELVRDDCVVLAHAYVKQNDLVSARDALEQACEYGAQPLPSCLELGAGYLRATYREPAAGRGRALLDWACPQMRSKLGPKMYERVTECDLATKQ